ncbi:unnamed protein product [Allacma fusca]|uniref:Uncharacterized protein n=1 Tax=Allacma fusca TaxID=39272 RepID=A0A8J2JBJ2_9HEXA|nr:unnamed protein product [Allacma fusca]
MFLTCRSRLVSISAGESGHNMARARIFGLLLAVLLSSATAVEELILTPLIREGNLAQAKERATDNIKLSHIKSSLNKPMTSYSGYLTVNEAYNSNIFFWLFPAIENPDTSSLGRDLATLTRKTGSHHQLKKRTKRFTKP